MMTILVTGATGFVGKPLVDNLILKVNNVRVLVRKELTCVSEKVEKIIVDDLSSVDDWTEILQSVDVVIHCAARVHIMNDLVADPLIEFRKVNVNATLKLARKAAEVGIKRFIFISSIKVNGEMTEPGQSFKPDERCQPEDPYGLSKYEAEQGLLKIAAKTDMEVVIIRPPLVYGPGVKANFYLMMKWVNKGIPLPLGAINNQRSFLALDNLVDFIIHCIDHPQAANEVFLISDSEDISTKELLKKVAKAFGKKPRLIPVPVKLMTLVAKLIRKSDVADRLLGSLQVDGSKAQNLLGWEPVVTMDEQLKKIADRYNEKTN